MKKSLLVCTLLLGCMVLLAADPIVLENSIDGVMEYKWELVSGERAQKLKELYEQKYRYVSVTGSNEDSAVGALHDPSVKAQVGTTPKGYYRVATQSMISVVLFLEVQKLVYYGHDYRFEISFTNTSYGLDSFIDLRYDKDRYEKLFRMHQNLL